MQIEKIPDLLHESLLYTALTKAKLVHWIPVFAALALRYRGIEEVMECCDDPPLIQLSNLATEAAAFGPLAWQHRLLLHRLARLPMFHWQAANILGERWDPLVEPLSEFSFRGSPTIWQGCLPCPSPDLVEKWLRTQVCAQ